MYKNNYFTESANTVLKLDKNSKWGYNKKKRTIFDDDEVANSALDYLYADAYKSKTQGFLKSNGFPSAGDRRVNRLLYGASEEQKQVRDLLKNKANNILNPGLNENDRAFLHGLMGDETGEREYQNRIAETSRRQSDLMNAFRGSQFESGLKQTMPISSASPQVKYITDDEPDANSKLGHTAVHDLKIEDNIAQNPDDKKASSPLKTVAYNDNNTIVAHNTNKSSNEVKLNGSALTEEDWNVYDALQQKGQSGAATDLLFSIEEATKAYVAAGDNIGKKNAARIQAVEARQAAYKKIGKTYVDNYDYTYGAGNSVFLGVHQVLGDNYHTSTIIMIFPDNPLYNTEGFENITESSPIQYMTLGAGPSFLFDGDLQSGYNRKKDRMFVNKVDMINLNVSDATVMAKLIACEKTYRQNQPLNYDALPQPQTEGYNSNSFTKGLLNACNVTSPTNLNFNVPGWEKAVPKYYFIK